MRTQRPDPPQLSLFNHVIGAPGPLRIRGTFRCALIRPARRVAAGGFAKPAPRFGLRNRERAPHFGPSADSTDIPDPKPAAIGLSWVAFSRTAQKPRLAR